MFLYINKNIKYRKEMETVLIYNMNYYKIVIL